MANELLSPFAEMLPRLYELKNATDQSHPDAYFHKDFESRFAEGRTVLEQRQRIERVLAALDRDAWSDLKARAAAVAHKKDGGRGWRELFDTFDEAKGYVHLQSNGCTSIAFIKRQPRRKSPDLRALQGSKHVLCEVKTINVSQDEAERRAQIAQGKTMAGDVSNSVKVEMLRKVSATLGHAVTQLDGEDPSRAARRLVFTVLHFDDWVGDYQTEYIAQLDAHLLANPVAGAELVFCPASHLFERRFTMRSATVVEL